MTFDEYQVLARRTQNDELTVADRLSHALHGLAAEVGEIHSIYQKAYQGHPVDTEKVLDELGDLLWFASELADAVGFHLSSAASHNVCKLLYRYPDGFDAERSVNRTEYQEVNRHDED